MRNFWQVLLAGLLVASCESIIEVEQSSPYESKVVVDGVFGPDSLWSIHLSLSQKLTTDSIPLFWPVITDASVLISSAAQEDIRLYSVGEGWYRVPGNQRPVAGETYNLAVSNAGHGNLTASSTIPVLKSSLISSFAQPPNDDNFIGDCEAVIQITDTPSADYYLIRLRQAGSADGSLPERWISFRSRAAALRTGPDALISWTTRELEAYHYHGGGWLADDLFDDSTYDVDLDCYDDEDRPYEFKVVVMALSRELFEYEQSVAKLESYLGSAELFVQRPPDVKSNVVGGLGIFGGYDVAVHEFGYIE